MADLKPCPFCGGEARIEVNVALRGYRAACKARLKCGAMFEWYDTENEAIEAWNTRKPEEAVIAELENKILDRSSAHAEAIIGMCGASANFYAGEMEAYKETIEIVRNGGKTHVNDT